MQDTLTQELSATRRLRLHARIAEVLEELYGAEAESHAAELAHHFAEAEAILGTEKLVDYSLLAGERALAAHAHEEALGHFQRALGAKEEQPVDAGTAALLFGLGRAQAAAVRWELDEPVANLRRAFDYYAEVGEVARAVAIAEYPTPTHPGHPSGLTQLISQALALVPKDSPEAGRLLTRYGIATGQEEGDYQGAQAAFSQALDIAQQTRDAALEMRTLAYAAQADFFLLHHRESIEKALQAIELSRHADEPLTQVVAHYSAMNALHPLGELEESRRHAEAMLPAAERLRDRFWLASALSSNEIVSRLEGDWQAARNFSDRGLAVSPLYPRILSMRVLLECQVGNYGQAEVYLEPLVESMTGSTQGPTAVYVYSAMALQVVAGLSGRSDHLDMAETASQAVLSSPSVNPLFALRANAGLALTAVLRGDAVTAEQQYSLLKPAAGTMLSNGFAAVDRVLGLLAHTIGNLDRAVAHFQDSLAFCREAGYKPELAWSCCDYSDTLRKRDSEGDRAKAIALLDESLWSGSWPASWNCRVLPQLTCGPPSTPWPRPCRQSSLTCAPILLPTALSPFSLAISKALPR